MPEFQWNDRPVEFVYADCGRTLTANESWYSKLRPFFIPNQTLAIMQDWGTWRDIPRRAFNQTEIFTGSHARELELVHQVRNGGLAAFVFTGA